MTRAILVVPTRLHVRTTRHDHIHFAGDWLSRFDRSSSNESSLTDHQATKVFTCELKEMRMLYVQFRLVAIHKIKDLSYLKRKNLPEKAKIAVNHYLPLVASLLLAMYNSMIGIII